MNELGNVKVTRRNITDYSADPANANQGTERGKEVIAESLKDTGPVRSIAADVNDTLIAGNKTWEAAKAAGITQVIEIETDGDALIVHKRRNLDLKTDPKARRAAYYDNRAGQLSLDWSAEQIIADLEAGVNLTPMFREDEIAELSEDNEIQQMVEAATGDGEKSGQRLGSERMKQVKPVLYLSDVSRFEAALRQTGHINRASALLAIVDFYLENHHAETGQFDL
jgi:hypothetical protein